MARKILLADDSITIQKVVELTFSDGDYEVIATTNGNKAIQKLNEFRPDIILSDIIMPEKNGYELCEYVKSHPEFRSIPVILLTGTFEPFDPDRAEKAGCDAVITKPFESQSLIHKVEELIQERSGSSPAAAPVPMKSGTETAPAETPQGETRAWPPPKLGTGWSSPAAATSDNEGSAFSAGPELSPGPAATPSAFTERSTFEEHGDDVYGAAPPAPSSPSLMSDEIASFDSQTRAMPKMSFEDLQRTATGASPEGDTGEYSGATKAFPKMSFDDLQRMGTKAPAEPEEPPLSGAWSSASEAAPASEWASPAQPQREPEASPFGYGEEPAAPAAPVAGSVFESAPSPAADTSKSPAPAGELSDEQIDRIARRVVELMSEQVVRNIAWEVIPDLAEMVVRERIRQLESEN